VLVFDHRDFPDAGTQIPAGTVEEGEALERALWREVHEETGLTADQLSLAGPVASYAHPDWGEAGLVEHFFHLTAVNTPDAWTHVVHGAGEDIGLVFNYSWLPLAGPLSEWRTRIPPWFAQAG
jgi:ADP-ribose pyrophosphatase YjhB (NUDIX family)